MTDTSVAPHSIYDIDKYNEAIINLKKILNENPLAIVPIDMFGTVKTEDPFDIKLVKDQFPIHRIATIENRKPTKQCGLTLPLKN